MRALEVEYEAAAAADVKAAAGLAERATRERAKVRSFEGSHLRMASQCESNSDGSISYLAVTA